MKGNEIKPYDESTVIEIRMSVAEKGGDWLKAGRGNFQG